MSVNKSAVVTVMMTGKNPKRGKAKERFALYAPGMTIGQYLAAGGKYSDVKHDLAKGFITLSE